jgi:hypothetical protein
METKLQGSVKTISTKVQTKLIDPAKSKAIGMQAITASK